MSPSDSASSSEVTLRIKLIRLTPILAILPAYLASAGVVEYYCHGECWWAVLGFVPPVVAFFAVDRYLRQTWFYPYAESELEEVDEDCPKCGSSNFGRTSSVYRCPDCGTEGM